MPSANHRKIISYIAMSVDGKIALPDGDVEWLHRLPNPDQADYGYADFIKGIDATIMGNATYQVVRGFGGPFPYVGLANYVFTRNRELQADEYVQFIHSELETFVDGLKKSEGKDIWLIGGGALNSLFLKNGWLDELRIFVMPIVLGDGIPLFSAEMLMTELKLTAHQVYSSGVVELTYMHDGK